MTVESVVATPSLWVVLTLVVVLAMAYRHVPLLIWTGTLTLLFLISSGLGVWSIPVLVVGWVLWLSFLALLFVPSVRRPITGMLYERGLRADWPRRFCDDEQNRQPMPWLQAFSNASITGQISHGPSPTPPTIEPSRREALERILGRIDPWKVETQGLGLGNDIIESLREAGWYAPGSANHEGATVSRSARDAPAFALMASLCPTLAATVALGANYEIASLIAGGGKAPPGLPVSLQESFARGEIATLFLDVRESRHGDARRICVDRREHEGRSDVLGVTLTFETYDLVWPQGTTHLAFLIDPADPRHYAGESETAGTSLLLVAADHPAISRGERQRTFGLGLSLVDLRIHDLFVPWEAVYDHERHGKSLAREILPQLRRHSVLVSGAIASGGLAAVAARVGALTLLDCEPVSGGEDSANIPPLLADMAREILIVDAVFNAQVAFDEALGDEPELTTLLGGRSSIHASRVVAYARRLVGRRALSAERRNPLAPYLMLPVLLESLFDAPARTQASDSWRFAWKLHPNFETYARQFMDSQGGHRSRLIHDRLLMDNLGRGVTYAVRSFLLGLRRAFRIRDPSRFSQVRYEAEKELARLSSAYALLLQFHLFVHHGRVFTSEPERALVFRRILATVFELMSLLRACAMETEEDGVLAELYATTLADLVAELEYHVHELILALPYAPERGLLRLLVSPTGRSQRAIDPAQERRIATILLAPSTAHDRLVGQRFIPRHEDDPGALLEWMFGLYGRVHDARRRVAEAVNRGLCAGGDLGVALDQARVQGLIDDEELRLLKVYESLRLRLLKG